MTQQSQAGIADVLGLRVRLSVRSPLKLKQCSAKLRGIAFEPKSWRDGRSQQVETTVPEPGTVHCEVTRRQRGRGSHYTVAKADLTLADAGDKTTVITGTAQVSYLYVGMMVGFVVLAVAQMALLRFTDGALPSALFVVFLVVIPVFYLGRLFRDRRDMIADINNAVQASPES
ncbi:MAG: hypothetical protein AAFV33_25950 [Chloroflexota bacterium]